MPLRFDCTPEAVLNIDQCACLSCLSTKELKAILLFMWAYIEFEENNIPQVIQDSIRWTMVSEKQLLEAEVCIMGNLLLGEALSPGTLQELIKCLFCYSEKQLDAATLYLKCLFWRVILILD